MGTLQTLRVGNPGSEVIAFSSHLRLHVTDRLHKARSSVSQPIKKKKKKKEKRKINPESVCTELALGTYKWLVICPLK